MYVPTMTYMYCIHVTLGMWNALEQAACQYHMCTFMLQVTEATFIQDLPVPESVTLLYLHSSDIIASRMHTCYNPTCPHTPATTVANSTTPSFTTSSKYLKLKRCMRCHESQYCSTTCQTADYSEHKRRCIILGKLRKQRL